MIVEKAEYDVTARASGHLEVCRSDLVLRDGVEISRTYHRYVVAPGDDVSSEPEIVRQLAAAVWPGLPDPPADPTVSQQILSVPDTLTGGPTIKEVFNGNV